MPKIHELFKGTARYHTLHVFWNLSSHQMLTYGHKVTDRLWTGIYRTPQTKLTPERLTENCFMGEISRSANGP